MEIEQLRREIDVIDDQIMGLLNRRARLSRSIGVLKSQARIGISDQIREQEVVCRALFKADHQLSRQSVREIFQLILGESRRIQGDALTAVETTELVYR